ncbi:hypothetical protein BCR33DRAFT_848035 [Rhizoclosmatium globosum]|uniref:Response regulatory domain-containing protein n=1 Tax=Rhizoclosmatium globosum TaxID=329046 RepID=A0A1Y2CNV0_9FUNG|nr:hypothetical protein BCR33DRAFT_848035 [Rhizoclosmatium globosum]|eukprot:ORY48672.1 hypothetical protein BCR33DRAFT_848035 [Rhizoclosmatium globosum]
MNPNVHNVNLADYTLISQAFTFGQVLGLVLVTFLFISDKEKCLRLTVESKAASDRGLYEDEVQKLKDKNILQFNSVVFAFKQINEQVTSLLLSLKDTEGNHEYQPLMQNIVGWKSDAANILSFSDDMMYLVRLQAKAVRLKPSKTNLSLFFTATISSLQSLLERNKILFQWLVEKLPETVYIDAVALQRILYHLVLKRECSPKVVSLRIRSTSCCYDTHDENFLHITVSCEGQKFELPLGQSLGSRLVEELLALFKGTVTQEIQTSTSMQIKLKIPYTTESVYEEDTVPFLDFSSAPFMAGKIYMHSMKLQSQNYFLDSFHSTNSTLRSSKSVVRRGGERRGSGFSTKSFKKHVTIEENPQPISRNASLYGSYRGSLRRNLMVPPVITLEKSPNISTSSSFENINSLNTIQGTQSGSTLTRLQAKALSQSVNFNGSDDVLGLEQARLSRSISTGQKSILKNGGGTLKRVSYHEGRRSSLRSTENIFVESVSTSSQDRSLTFLLADKSTVFRKLLANMLKPHSIREAENETDILNLCAKDKFDAIFMDFDFSIVLDLAKNLVNDRLHPPAIVLITSQTISSKEKRILTLAGVFQILEKPITKDMIAECLKSLSLSLVQSNASSNTLNHAITTAVKSETSLRRKSTTNIHNRSSAVQFKHGHIYQSRMNNDNRITEQNETNLAHNRSSTTDVVMIDVHEDSPLEANVEKTPVFLHVMSNDTITN